jgi:hypothetical protein
MGRQDYSKQNDPKTRQVATCRTCLAEDGESNSRAVEKMISHPMHKNRHSRMVFRVGSEAERPRLLAEHLSGLLTANNRKP